MMDEFDTQLNNVLVETFKSILKVEELSLQNAGLEDLSISEMHLLEAVGKDKENGRTISDIAQEFSVTLPSVTIAINKLMAKGYVKKIKGAEDKRVVYVVLTKTGKKLEAAHKYFHEQMIRNISREFTKDEKAVLLKGIQGLNDFFNRKITAISK